jgi:hypothetical protein
MKTKRKGINARAWFYSTSFVSGGLNFEPSQNVQALFEQLGRELRKLEAKEPEPAKESASA